MGRRKEDGRNQHLCKENSRSEICTTKRGQTASLRPHFKPRHMIGNRLSRAVIIGLGRCVYRFAKDRIIPAFLQESLL